MAVYQLWISWKHSILDLFCMVSRQATRSRKTNIVWSQLMLLTQTTQLLHHSQRSMQTHRLSYAEQYANNFLKKKKTKAALTISKFFCFFYLLFNSQDFQPLKNVYSVYISKIMHKITIVYGPYIFVQSYELLERNIKIPRKKRKALNVLFL